jgi:hypothetical protein
MAGEYSQFGKEVSGEELPENVVTTTTKPGEIRNRAPGIQDFNDPIIVGGLGGLEVYSPAPSLKKLVENLAELAVLLPTAHCKLPTADCF